MSQDLLLKIRGLSKQFGNVRALQDVDLEVYKSEIIGLVGDNGAGKSTLIKIISGNYGPDKGEIWFNGRKISIKTPKEARKLGIETVYQDFGLCENLDSVGNIFIGRELTRNYLFGFIRVLQESRMEKYTKEVIESLDIELDSVRRKAQFLSGGQRQAVAFGRAARWGARLLLLDEPTASLGAAETEKVLEIIRSLREEKGITVIIISHNLQHVFPVVDRIVVLRRGRVVGNCPISETDPNKIIELITGKILKSFRGRGDVSRA